MNDRSCVVFDFGGVLTSSPFEAFNALEDERGLPRDLVRRINTTNPDGNAWALFERGEIDEATFDERFGAEARALGYELPGRDVLARLSGDLRPRMVAALGTLHDHGYRLGCVTNNMPAGHGAQMSRTADEADAIGAVMARFDHVVESSRIGVRKPDPRVYEMACDALGVRPQDCVYLDDLGINCKPAAAMGMHAIKVTGEQQALDELERALGLGAGALSA